MLGIFVSYQDPALSQRSKDRSSAINNNAGVPGPGAPLSGKAHPILATCFLTEMPTKAGEGLFLFSVLSTT